MVDFDPSSWLTEGGIDSQPVALRNVTFTKDVEYQDGQEPFLSVDIVPLDGETTPFEGQRLGIGKGWEEAEDGSSITRNDGKKLAYNTQSKAGRLVGSLMSVKEFQQAVKAKWDAGEQVTPFQAAFFEGITGTIHANAGSFKAKDTGEEITYTYYTFSDFTGYEGAGAGAGAAKPVSKKSASKKAPSKKAASKPAPAEAVEETVSNDLSDLTARLTEHARQTAAETHDEWMLEAYEAFADDLSSDEAAALVEDPAAVWDVVCAE
jgi:hypothetical protein